MDSIQREDYRMYLIALNDANKTTQNRLFDCLNSYQQNLYFIHSKMNENVKKSVIEIIQNDVTVKNDDKSYDKINQLFSSQNLWLIEMHKRYINYISKLQETTNILHNQLHIAWFNTFFINNNIETSLNKTQQIDKRNSRLKSHIMYAGKYKCKFCVNSFTDISLLKTHERIHTNENPFKRNESHNAFTQRRPPNHINQIHTNNVGYVCAFCFKRFLLPEDLLNHTICHTKKSPYQSNQRNTFATEDELNINCNQHANIHNNNDDNITEISKTNNHKIDNDNNDNNVANKDSAEIITTHTYNNDMDEETEEEVINNNNYTKNINNNKYKCDDQRNAFATEDELMINNNTTQQTQMSIDEELNITQISKTDNYKTNNDNKDNNNHVVNKDYTNEYKCFHCNEKSKTQQIFEHHNWYQHQDGKPYKCTHCNASYMTNAGFRSHINRIHTNNNITTDGPKLNAKPKKHKDKPKAKPKLKKKAIKKKMKRKNKNNYEYESDVSVGNLKDFVISHGTLTYTNITDNDNDDKKDHINQIYTNNGKYPCKYCPKRFSAPWNLKMHERIHRNKCNKCNKSFTHKMSLINHINEIHTNNGKYACKHCSQRFIIRSDLVIHARCHLNGKPFKCNECTKVFTTQSYLKQHQTIHSGEKPYAYKKLWYKTFTHRSGRNTHQGNIVMD